MSNPLAKLASLVERGGIVEEGRAVRNPYVPGLDGIRALAVLMVLAFHSTSSHPLPGGYVGVDVFFVLSGFLITQQLLGGHSQLVWFLARRLARLYPALLAMVAFAVFATAFGGGVPAACFYAPLYFLNVLIAHKVDVGDANLVAHTWSLAVEVQFYTGWAIILLYLERRCVSRRTILALAIALSLGSLAVRAFYQVGLHNPTLAYFSTEARLDGLFLGAALAVVVAMRPSALAALAKPAFALPVLAVSATSFGFASNEGQLIAIPLAALAAASLLCTTVARPTARTSSLLASKWPRAIGLRSYSLYLWHVPIFVLLQNHTSLATPALIVTEWVMAFALAEASFRLIETPSRRALYARIREARGRRHSRPAVLARVSTP